jgi:hypothetical protein
METLSNAPDFDPPHRLSGHKLPNPLALCNTKAHAESLRRRWLLPDRIVLTR